jgi:hypothetical protein
MGARRATGAEADRLEEAHQGRPWRQWGPYLSERQWGTVREDYSDDGDAWNYFTHDEARSRVYRWGEDGLAGFSDDHQHLCLALALWNGADPIVKERLFGLTNAEGNHGEDVKEYYFYVDATPTSSYLQWRYKYPHAAYPYDDLVATNRSRSRTDLEYELVDTGVFDGDRYFDIVVEYAKAAPDDVLMRITATNRGPDPAWLHVLPTLWFRNSWWAEPDAERPLLRATPTGMAVDASHPAIGSYRLSCDGTPELLFTENETNTARLFGVANASPFVKDAIHDYLVAGRADAVNGAGRGTKVAAHYPLAIDAGNAATLRLRLAGGTGPAAPFDGFDAVVSARAAEADEFYRSLTPVGVGPDAAMVMRQALAGMLWSKQHYYFDLDRWLAEHGVHPLLSSSTRDLRNRNWFHMVNDDVISMPDKWEYPWYAAWDLAFHTVALSMVDLDGAKEQLTLMLRELYLHPSGQIPAYEWNFGDVNPPVHAWAVKFVFDSERAVRGEGDLAWLRRAFEKLLLNFTWWVNRKDPSGRNVFEGGFLGLDNIGVFDRSAPLPGGGSLEQADGTAWMAFFAQNMLQIAAELALQDAGYEDMVVKFLEHFLWIAAAMDRMGDNHDEMWDEQDGFFYDVLRRPDGTVTRLKVRSIVGLLSLCAVTVLPQELVARQTGISTRLNRRLAAMPELLTSVHDARIPGERGRRMLSVLNESHLRRVLAHALDESQFLGPYGLRSLSRYHRDHPYVFVAGGREYRVAYLPAESDTGMFGGNSNWRGPVWFPINLLVLRALLHMYTYFGDGFRVECPTGSGRELTLFEVAREIGGRLVSIFTRGADGRRPVYGGTPLFQTDPHWRDLISFYEYFHGDEGAGLGASHQTGWTGVVAKIIQMLGAYDAHDLLEHGVVGLVSYQGPTE